MDARTNAWMGGRTDRLADIRTDGQTLGAGMCYRGSEMAVLSVFTNGRTDARTDGLMDARMNGRMDGRADGRKCSVALFFFFVREGKILNCHTEVPDINRIRS